MRFKNNKPRYVKIIQCVIFSTLLSSCDVMNEKLFIVNHTDNKIYYRLLTDTMLYKDFYVYPLNNNDSVFPSFVLGSGEDVWENKINRSSLDSTLHVYVFKIDTIPNNKLTEKIIHDKKNMRLDFKVRKLEELNWKIELR